MLMNRSAPQPEIRKVAMGGHKIATRIRRKSVLFMIVRGWFVARARAVTCVAVTATPFGI